MGEILKAAGGGYENGRSLIYLKDMKYICDTRSNMLERNVFCPYFYSYSLCEYGINRLVTIKSNFF